MTKPSLISTNTTYFPTNTPKYEIFRLQNTSGGQEPPHAPATQWFSEKEEEEDGGESASTTAARHSLNVTAPIK